jgi:hypothetical protein
VTGKTFCFISFLSKIYDLDGLCDLKVDVASCFVLFWSCEGILGTGAGSIARKTGLDVITRQAYPGNVDPLRYKSRLAISHA